MNLKEILKLAIWSGVKRKEGKRREYLSTNDLDTERKLKPNYKTQRKNKENISGISDVGTHDIWPD